MNVQFSSTKQKRILEDDTNRTKRYGAEMAKLIKHRLDALAAADSLADFWPSKTGPERCHELKGDRAGTFSMDLKHPYRLLFWPLEVPEGLEALDEKQRWQAIKTVEIQDIEDTHG